MNNEEYYKSLTLELNSLKDRVRNFIGNRHWQTDGEWKESVLRTILRRHLPQTIGIGKGFVMQPNGEPSTQIDILFYDISKPVLYQENDLLIVSPDVALGVIEVKTKVRNSELQNSLDKLATLAEIMSHGFAPHRFFGLFSYERDDAITDPLQKLQNAVRGVDRRVINCFSLGESYFVRYWDCDPTILERQRPVNRWHAYNLEQKAPAYFIYNVVEHLCPHSVSVYNDLWFPENGKEPNKIGQIDRLVA